MELAKKVFSHLNRLREKYDYINSWLRILLVFYTTINALPYILEPLPFPWYLTLLIIFTCLIWVVNGSLYFSHKSTEKAPVLSIRVYKPYKTEVVAGHIVDIKNREGCDRAKRCFGSLTLDADENDIASLDPIKGEIPPLGDSEPDRWAADLLSGGVKIEFLPGGFGKIENHHVCWTVRPNPPYTEIGGGEEKGLDICRVLRTRNGPYICIPTSGEWNHIRAIIKPGEYKGELSIRADNADTVRRQFTIIPDSDQNDIRIDWA